MSASAELVRELARFFARNPEARERLQTEHAPGADGRCRVCRSAGDGSGRVLGCVLAAVLDDPQPLT